jgi:hypothetical protein
MNVLLAVADSDDGIGGGTALTILLVAFAFFVLVVVGLWKTFEKAGEAGWKSIIPIYNMYVMLKIVGRPGWWVILLFIPFVSFIVWIFLAIDLARSFGKGGGFAIGLILLTPLFVIILGWGGASYVGPAAAGGASALPPPPPPPPPPSS